MSKPITQDRVNYWVSRIRSRFEYADAVEAMSLMLAEVGVEIKKPWKDGDLVKGTADADVFYVRRNGRWFEVPNAGAVGRTYDDTAIDRFIYVSEALVEVTDFGAQPEGDDDD